jgi:uncharacterized protein YcbK (DUF882 family)
MARRIGLAAVLLIGSHGLQSANAAGDTRTLSLHNIHTHEDLTITYKKNGRIDDEALKKLNSFLRDWRQEQEVRIDPQLFDMLWEVHREVNAQGPIHVVCGYRSPDTNAMLRRRSGGVARTSLHMQGKAIDFSIPSADVAEVRAAALRIQGGGVGYYPTSGVPFVHMDVGNVRHWPRMTREQLVKVFPNGRTLHVPTDGSPLPGYELALADTERSAMRRPVEQPKQRSLLAALFGIVQDAEETADIATSRQTPAPRRTTTVAAAPETGKPVPLPPSRPMFQLASSSERPAPRPAARQVNLASLTPNQIIEVRGYWQGLPEAAQEVPAAGATSISSARRAAGRQTASADVTASIGPFERNDRVSPDIALAYAAQAEAPAVTPRAAPTARPAPAVVTTTGSGSFALKPAAIEPASPVRPMNAGERLNDPWLRGVVVAPSVQTSMTTTTFGAPDFRNLGAFMQKPASTVMMTFSGDPHLGMTYEQFTGSAVVFQATVTFGMKTAALR